MNTRILNGAPLKDTICGQIAADIACMKERHQGTPGIAFVAVVGHEPLLKYTIGIHEEAARALGFNVVTETRPASVTEQELCDLIDKLNRDAAIHAIVLLQPVPAHLSAIRIVSRIHPDKEVEGFHPANAMNMVTMDTARLKYPMVLSTSLSELFKANNVEIPKDSEWVFVVDDAFLATPFTNMVVRIGSAGIVPGYCSSTIVNHDSARLAEHCRRADFMVVVSKHPEFMRGDLLKPGVCIIDVYSNLVKEIPSKKNPTVLVPVIRGGVNVQAVEGVAGTVSPCPGGLMPVVLAVLFRNALTAFKRALGEIN